MLEKSRRQGTSIFVYLIFCLLIAIFVINFGPQGGSSSGSGGCRGASNVIVSVNGQEASQSTYHIAYANQFNRGQGKQKTFVALETIIRRELLAQEAEKLGLRVNADLVMEEIKKGNFFLGGQRTQIPGIFDENGFWNLRQFKAWYSNMNVSRSSYVNEQGRSLLATMMSQILQDSVQVSRDEALQHFLFEGNTVQYDVVAFRPETYKDSMKLTDADVERFLTTHAKEVEDRYKADERTYKGMKPQLKLHQIFIAKLEEEKPATPPEPAPDAGSAAGSGAGSAAPAAGSGAGSAAPTTPPTPPKAEKNEKPGAGQPRLAPALGMPIEEAKKKLEAARVSILGNKDLVRAFKDNAKTLNTDEALKASGGELGWRTADNAMLGEKAVTDAVKTLKAGEMTPVIATDRGAYLVLAETSREGDLTFDQVKHEIAKDLAKDVWSKEAAKRAAISALDKARSGTGSSLDLLYEKEPAPAQGPGGPGGIDIQQILNDPNMPPEQKKQLIEMIMQQQQQKSGALVWESNDVPAAWRDYNQADGAGGSAGSAAGVMMPVGSAAPTNAGSATVPAAGAGSGSSAAAPTATPTPPVVTTVVPSSDQLPAFDNVKAPYVSRFGPAPRSPMMSGLGTSKEAAAALFDELSAGMIATRVYEADGAFVVVQLIGRNAPKVEEFEKEGDRLVEELRRERAQAFVEEWLQERCEKLRDDKKIKPNSQLIQEFDDAGKAMPVTYQPCMSFR